MNTDLIIQREINPIQVFSSKKELSEILKEIETEAKSRVIDISTEDGEKELASLGYKIARSKTYLDDAGKKIVEEAKKQVKEVDELRKFARDSLDELKAEIVRPLTEKKERERQRIESLEAAMKRIDEVPNDVWSLEDLENAKKKLKELGSEDFAEFAGKAKSKVLAAELQLEALEARFKKQAEELAEQKKLEEQKRLEREEEIRRKAQEEAEQKAQKAIEQAKLEQDRKAEQAKADQEKKIQEAIEKAKRDAEIEKAKEIKKVVSQIQKSAEKPKDKDVVAEIHNKIVGEFVANGFSEEDAKKIVSLIYKKKIGNLKIIYQIEAPF